MLFTTHAAADDRLGDPQLVSQCHDGQEPTGAMPCDADKTADGTCTFGQGEKQESISVGRSTKLLTSTGIVAQYTCVAALQPSSEESESGSAAAAVAHNRTTTKMANTTKMSNTKKVTNKKVTNSTKISGKSGGRGIGAKILAPAAAKMP
jgi:hypothetical protein